MGIWEAMASTADGVRRRLPDPAPMKKACTSVYGLGTATVNAVRAASPDLSAASAICRRSASWIYRTVRVDAPRQISTALSDPDGPNRIARTTLNLLDHALEYGTRPYTGGIPAYRILKEGLFYSDHPTAAGKELNDLRRRLKKVEELEAARGAEGAAAEGIVGSAALRYDHHMRRASNPADVIESFMMSGFRGGDFINEQVVPVVDENRRRAGRDFPVVS
ncbi:uncharacterized protein LOC110109427 [Dendrobium catenatum]|uniref:Uncharacterized protein n=1 Tax=Dendrobium catenatum TaxID=906689 RepID=A0A2I0WD72_9ASPA|nr:uncharacterized protein LOC110109427 [Dendrobium catenatum]PKU73605.1 hypothetical protein MA16_Dca013125 [Dendrobium catenatum]